VHTGNTQTQRKKFTYIISTRNTNGENGHDLPNMGLLPAKRQHACEWTQTTLRIHLIPSEVWPVPKLQVGTHKVFTYPKVLTVFLSHMQVKDSKLNFRQAIFASSQIFILASNSPCLTHAVETYLIILAMFPSKFARSCSRLYRPGDSVETGCLPNPVWTGDTCGSGAMTGLNKTSCFKIGSCAVVIYSCGYWETPMCLRFRP
jgi:hypothetical protein